MTLYRQPSPSRTPSRLGAHHTGGGLLITLAMVGLLPVVGALREGEPIQGASAAGFAIALLAVVILLSELRQSRAKPLRPETARSAQPPSRRAPRSLRRAPLELITRG